MLSIVYCLSAILRQVHLTTSIKYCVTPPKMCCTQKRKYCQHVPFNTIKSDNMKMKLFTVKMKNCIQEILSIAIQLQKYCKRITVRTIFQDPV